VKHEQEGSLQVADQHGRATPTCCFVPCHLLPDCGRGLQAEACVNLEWAERNVRICDDADVRHSRQQLPAAQTAITVSAFDVQVGMATSRVLFMQLLTHGPLPRFAWLFLVTRQAVMTRSSKDSALQCAAACMPDHGGSHTHTQPE